MRFLAALLVVVIAPSFSVRAQDDCLDPDDIHRQIEEAIDAVAAGTISAETFGERVRHATGREECYQRAVPDCQGGDCLGVQQGQ